MIVPKFWAEGRVQERVKGKQVTIRRFGWSDTSEADAQAAADIRAREALLRFMAGDKIVRREPKMPYNGAEGVPIREEIISRHGETIVTRNIYGARCLNTPDVLFADVDFQETHSAGLGCACVSIFAIGAVALGINSRSFGIGFVALFVGAMLGLGVATLLHRTRLLAGGGAEKIARRRIDRFIAAHPDWTLRVYRTPAGFRALAMHRIFQPAEPAVQEFFKALATDPLYVQMCVKQQCFRARVSPKPWRIGISQHMRPRPGIWPVRPERLPDRNAWIEHYEQVARNHASCRFVEAIGSGNVHATALAVQHLHDDLSRATTELPMG